MSNCWADTDSTRFTFFTYLIRWLDVEMTSLISCPPFQQNFPCYWTWISYVTTNHCDATSPNAYTTCWTHRSGRLNTSRSWWTRYSRCWETDVRAGPHMVRGRRPCLHRISISLHHCSLWPRSEDHLRGGSGAELFHRWMWNSEEPLSTRRSTTNQRLVYVTTSSIRLSINLLDVLRTPNPLHYSRERERERERVYSIGARSSVHESPRKFTLTSTP